MPQATTQTDYRLRFASVSHIAALRPTVTAMLESVTFTAANFAAVIHIAVFVAATLAVLALVVVISIVVDAEVATIKSPI